MRIGIDVDGTLYRWTDAVNKAIKEQFGIRGLREHTHWNYLRDKLTDEQFQWVWSRAAAEPVFGRKDMAYPGSRKVVNALCAKHEVHFVTHRNPRMLSEVTGRWLASHYVGFAGVHVLWQSVPKVSLADWDVFIDDKPETVAEFEAAGVRILVPARAWNGGCGGEQFADWRDVPGLLATS